LYGVCYGRFSDITFSQMPTPAPLESPNSLANIALTIDQIDDFIDYHFLSFSDLSMGGS
jgi:hypothetical protein